MFFVGRSREFEQMRDALAKGDELALIGPSGVGKTSLAATFCQAEFDGSFVRFDLHGLDLEATLEAVSDVLETEAGQSPAEAMVSWVDALENRGAKLVLFDDLGFDFDQLAVFRDDWPGKILVTTQNPVPGVPMMTIGPFESLDDALELFGRVAGAIRAGFDIDEDRESVTKIVRAVGRHPLAIGLAARRCATFPPAIVLDSLLEDGMLVDRTLPDRHQTLSKALEFTWDRLELEHKQVLYTLAQFSRPIRVTEVADIAGLGPADFYDTFSSLVLIGLVHSGNFPTVRSLIAPLTARLEATHPDVTSSINASIKARAQRSARQLPSGLKYVDVPSEGPSFWIWAIEHEDRFDDDDLAAIVAAYLRWQRFRAMLLDAEASLEALRPTLNRLDDSNAYLQAAWLAHWIAIPAASELVTEAARCAGNDVERGDARLLELSVELEESGLDQRELVLECRRIRAETGREYARTMELRSLAILHDRAEMEQSLEGFEAGEVHPILRMANNYMTAWLAPNVEAALELLTQHREEARRLRAHDSELTFLFQEYEVRMRAGLVDGRFEAELESAKQQARRRGGGWIERWAEPHGRFVELESLPDDELYNESRDDHSLFGRMWAFFATVASGRLDEAAAILEEHPSISTWSLTSSASLHLFELLSGRPLSGRVDGVPELDPVRAMLEHEPESVTELVELWPALQPAFGDFAHDAYLWNLRRFLLGRLPPQAHEIAALSSPDVTMARTLDFKAYHVDGTWFSIEANPVKQSLLRALEAAERPLSKDELIEQVYPDDRSELSALRNRFDVLLSRTRSMGLKSKIVFEGGGYRLTEPFTTVDDQVSARSARSEV